MSRLPVAFVVGLLSVSSATATLAPPKETPTLGVEAPQGFKLPAKALQSVAEPGDTTDYVLTERTEIILNGKPSKYAEVPSSARIIRMELAVDQRTVLKIHFRTGK